MTAPKWAQDLILDVLVKHEYDRIPDMVWRHRSGVHSSGTCYTYRIVLSAGTDRTDAKLVLLHELAHWLLPMYERHSPRFWRLAWQLYREYRLPIRYTLQREASYRKGARAAYANLRRNGS